ncbi:MAG: hypothetical protein MUF64_11140 [Polyangiaceae bacterium]|jgi:hypothetical protein|nr:hypothetical protein [Polyangiaceae bacterium]
MSKSYGYGVECANTFGLNPAEYFVHIGVNRRDGKALTPAQLAAIEAALAPLASKTPAPTGDPAKVQTLAAENEAKHKAMVAKVTGKAPAGKASGKRKTSAGKARKAAAKPTKSAKGATRKAARRSEG